jgi:hypothetical protein
MDRLGRVLVDEDRARSYAFDSVAIFVENRVDLDGR